MLNGTPNMKLRVTYYAIFVLRRNYSSVEELLNPSASMSMRTNDIFLCNSSITSCFRSGDVDNAQRLFDNMPRQNLVSWNCMISGYIQNSKLSEAQRLFDMMPKRNVVSWTALMAGYAKFGMLSEAEDLFDKMPERNIVCWNSIITGCIDNKRLDKALKYFNAMPTRNSVSWAVMIGGYIQDGHVTEARELFDQAPHKVTSLYNALLSGYVELGYTKDAWELFKGMPQRDVASWTTIISCFSKAGEMERARALFEGMPATCVEAYTAMTTGYMQIGDLKLARSLFNKMPHRDVVAWNSMINGYVMNGMLKEALALFLEMPKQDTRAWNSILKGYVQEGDTNNALSCFHRIPQKDQASWNIMISGYQSEEALYMFCRMIQDGFKPDQGSFTVVISVCGVLAFLGWGRALHACAVKYGFYHDKMVMSSLIAMYAKCGLITEAFEVFHRMLKRDTVAWNAMLLAQAYHGSALETFNLFRSMIEAGCRPDHVTFLGMLSTCSHNGLVNEGLKAFKSMQNEWKLTPRSEHYTSVIDLLGRAGHLSEAFGFVQKLPGDLSTNAWESLLSACRVHGNLELGELVAKQLLKSKPLDGGLYVLLANIYAAKGMWEEATSIRTIMKAQGARKEQSCSWIEIEGKTSVFVSSDRSHTQTIAIQQVLESILLIMEEAS